MAKKLSEVIEEAKSVTIVTRKLTQQELGEFVNYVESLTQEERSKGVSLTRYIEEKFYKGKDAVIVPDISGLQLDGTSKKIDLQGIDFTGSIINGVRFINCDLTESVFCECDMNNVYFDKTKLVNTDFRGAILIGATLGKGYDFIGQRKTELNVSLEYVSDEDYLGITPSSSFSDGDAGAGIREKRQEARETASRNFTNTQKAESSREKQVQAQEEALIKGAKFDTTVSLAYKYKREHSDEKSEQKERVKQELEKQLANKKKQLDAKIEEINEEISEEFGGTLGQTFYWAIGSTDYNGKRQALETAKTEVVEELAKVEQEYSRSLQERHFAYREDSFVRAMSDKSEFDPCYKRGASPEERNKKYRYIDTSREDIKAYLEEIKQPDKNQLSLNEFVRAKHNRENPNDQIPDDVLVHADCSSSEYDTKKDFSNMLFFNANLEGVNFAGCKLNRAVFNGTNISYSSFESAELSEARFIDNVNARYTNFFRASMEDVIIRDSDFTDTILAKSNAPKAVISKSKLTNARGQYVNLDGAGISNSNLDNADLTGASIIRANIEKTSMVGVRLDNAIIDYCRFKECNLREASLQNVRAQFAKFESTDLEKIKAENANFVEANFDEFCNLSEADLRNAVMQRIKLNGVNLRGANMQFVDLTDAQMEKAIVEDAEMQFTNLTRTIANDLKASGVNMTGAILKEIEARRADFTKAILKDVKAQQAKLAESILTEANLLGADFTNAILEKTKINNALVNLHTLFKGANIEGLEGGDELLECTINADGTITKTKVNITELIRKTELAEDAASRGFLRKSLGSVIQSSGTVIQVVGGFVKQPFSDKIGFKTGAVIGLIIALCVVAAVVVPLLPGAWLATPFITAALSVANVIPGVGLLTSSIAVAAIPMKILAVTISVAAPTLLTTTGVSASAATITAFATAAAGLVTTIGAVSACALAGRYVVQHIKFSHIAAATAGFTTGFTAGVVLGPLAPLVGFAGAIAAVISTVLTNTVVEKVTGTRGMTLDGLVASGIAKGGELTKGLGGWVGITPEQTELLKEWKQYTPEKKEEFKKSLEQIKQEILVERVQVIQKVAKVEQVVAQRPEFNNVVPQAKQPGSNDQKGQEKRLSGAPVEKLPEKKFTDTIPPKRRASLSDIEGTRKESTVEKHSDRYPPKIDRSASMSDLVGHNKPDIKQPPKAHEEKVGSLQERQQKSVEAKPK